MPPPADIVKVAIEWPGAYPKLMEIDQVSKAGKTAELTTVFLPTLSGWRLWIPLRRSLRGCEIWAVIAAVQSVHCPWQWMGLLQSCPICWTMSILGSCPEAVVLPSRGTG